MVVVTIKGERKRNMTKTKCIRCKYQWDYTGTSWFAKCPRCRQLQKTALHPDVIATQKNVEKEGTIPAKGPVPTPTVQGRHKYGSLAKS